MDDVTVEIPPDDGVGEFARLAGLLFLIASGIEVTTWFAQSFWDLWPRWVPIADTSIQVAIGFYLLRMRCRTPIVPLSFIAVVSMYPLIQAVAPLNSQHPAVLAGAKALIPVLGVPLVFGTTRALPYFLLLLGTPTRRRRIAAIAVFGLWEFVHVATAAMTIWALRYFRPQ
jgi:hypothetical protein